MQAMLERKRPLGELLVARGLLKPEELARALDEQKRSGHQKLIGEVLVDLGFCSEEHITEALAEVYGVPYARVTPRLADPKAIAVLPKEFLEKHLVLPLFVVEGKLTIAVAEPANVFLIEEIERVSGCEVQLVAATARDIRATLQAYLPNESVFVIDEIIDEVNLEDLRKEEPANIADIANLEAAAGDSPVVKLVNYCIFSAVKELASDIHIEPHENHLRVRFRIDGRLVERLRPPLQMHPAVVSRIKIMAGLDIAERRLPQDGGIHVLMNKRPIDLRVSCMPGRNGEKVVIRVIEGERAGLNLERLGFGYDTLKAWRKLIHRPNGIVLVTGPTGSGKTTTLYASLHELNSPDVNICTVEDPVEYAIAGINQFQTNDKVGFGFANVLRSLLRQDPDILMVGEVRDAETAKVATQAALTGHLVLTTLHTNDAPSAVTRLYNIGVEPYLVGATLAGVLAQRLVRKLCPACREPVEPGSHEWLQVERACGSVQTVFRARGCPRCRGLGFAGRVGIYELFVPDDQTVDAIGRGAALNELRELARSGGMRSLRADGFEKVQGGLTTLDEVLRVTA